MLGSSPAPTWPPRRLGFLALLLLSALIYGYSEYRGAASLLLDSPASQEPSHRDDDAFEEIKSKYGLDKAMKQGAVEDAVDFVLGQQQQVEAA